MKKAFVAVTRKLASKRLSRRGIVGLAAAIATRTGGDAGLPGHGGSGRRPTHAGD